MENVVGKCLQSFQAEVAAANLNCDQPEMINIYEFKGKTE